MMSLMFGTVTMNGEIMSITEIKGLENFKTNKVTDMGGMFANCINLKYIDISNFDTENLKGAEFMFINCRNITELNLKNFRTDNAVYIDGLFMGCSSLKEIDISSFNTSKVQNTYDMFDGCTNLKTIYVSEYDETTDTGWTTKNVVNSDRMFTGCTSLVGGKGTTYDSTHIDKEYARIDKYGEPGYLTNKKENRLKYYDYYTESTFMSSGVAKNNSIIGYYTDNDGDGINELTFVSKETIYANIDSSRLFMGFTEVKNINFDNFSTKGVTNIIAMFSDCYKLTKIDVSKFDTSEVTLFEGLFGSMYDNVQMNLQEIIGIENWNTSKVISMNGMFYNCRNLTSINLRNFDTSQVLDMDWMFWGCSSLTELNVKNFNTSKLKTMRGMFSYCNSLTNLDISSFNTSQVTEMRTMLNGCTNLKTIYVTEYNETTNTGWTTKNVTNSAYMFDNCTSLVGGNGTVFDSAHIDKEYARIDKYGEPGYFTNIKKEEIKDGTLMQVDSTSQTYFNSGINKTEIEKITFSKGAVPTTGIISQFDASVEQDGRIIGYFTDTDGNNLYELTFISNGIIYTNENSSSLFKGLSNIITIEFNNINTEKTTDMTDMFANCTDLSSLDLNSFNTSKVTSMQRMFIGCSKLTEIKFGKNFNTQNVTNMNMMFQVCSSLITLDLSLFNTSKVTNMEYMFYNCRELQKIYVSEYNETNNTGWTTKNVTNSSRMFFNNMVLVGGNGTEYNSSHIDATYARIDTVETPGYFTNINDKQ